MDDGMKFYTAYLHAHACAEAALLVHTIKEHANRTSSLYLAAAVRELTTTAGLLGYTLTPIEAPAEAAPKPVEVAA
jgi:hypothetical protein